MSIYTRYLTAGRRLVAESDGPPAEAIAAAVHRLEECLSQIMTYGGADQERVRLAVVIAELDRLCRAEPRIGVTFQEYSRGERVAAVAPGARAVSMLIAQCAPDGLLALRQAEEFSAIEEELGASTMARFDLVYCHAAQMRRLTELAAAHEPAVIHFSGHGTADNLLMLHDTQGGGDAVTISELVEALPRGRVSPRLVVLNACWTDAQALAICSVSPCAIGIRDRWADTSAVLFARQLYRGLGAGCSVGVAFRDAVSRLAEHAPHDARLPELRAALGVDVDTVSLWGRDDA